MNQHLSEEQISRWILGERTAEEAHHARGCPACWAEIARTESALAAFRGALRQQSEQCEPPAVDWTAANPRHFFSGRPMQWALAGAVAILLAAAPLYRAHDQQRKAEIARADAVLLEEVDAGISRGIAEPMEPLTRLVAWDSNATEGTNR